MPPTAAAAKPSDTPSLYVQGWLSAQDAAVPPSQTEVTSGDERTSPVSASQERTGASSRAQAQNATSKASTAS